MTYEQNIKQYRDMENLEGVLHEHVAGFQRPEFSDPATEATVQAMDGKLDHIGLDLWFASTADIEDPDAQTVVADYTRFVMRYDSGPGAGTNRLYYKQTSGPENELQPYMDWYNARSKDHLGLAETKNAHLLQCMLLELQWLMQIERYKTVMDGLPLEPINQELQAARLVGERVLRGLKPVPATMTADMIETHVAYARRARKQSIAEELAWMDDVSQDDEHGYWVPRDSVFALLAPEDLRLGMSRAEANALLETRLLYGADA